MSYLTRVLLIALAIHEVTASCAADNCYNQISRHGAGFCATYTTTVNTNTGAIPTYVSASCGPQRVSSACSCLRPASSQPATCTGLASTVTITSVSTVTASSTASPGASRVQNGDFPGLAPWFNGDIINESSYNYNTPVVTSPGYSGGYSA